MINFKQFREQLDETMLVESSQKEQFIYNSHGSHALLKRKSINFSLKENVVNPSFEKHFLGHKTDKSYSENHRDEISKSREIVGKLIKNNPISKDAREYISSYMLNDSSGLTKRLLDTHKHVMKHNNLDNFRKDKKPDKKDKIIQGLDNYAFSPASEDFDSYSGVKFDISKVKPAGKSKNGNPIYHQPTFMSSSTSKHIANEFTDDESPIRHIFHWKNKKGDSISAVAGVHHDEHEILLNRGNKNTYIEHLGHKDYTDKNGKIVRVHEVRKVSNLEINN